MSFSSADAQSLMEITTRPPLYFVSGEGSWLTDDTGKRYLDCIQGWAVNCLGHCPPQLIKALNDQAGKLINPSPAFYNEPSVALAKRLIDASCFDRVFFTNSGAEANEGVIKLARKWGQKNKKAPTRLLRSTTVFMVAHWPPCLPRARLVGTRSLRRRSMAFLRRK